MRIFALLFKLLFAPSALTKVNTCGYQSAKKRYERHWHELNDKRTTMTPRILDQSSSTSERFALTFALPFARIRGELSKQKSKAHSVVAEGEKNTICSGKF